MQTIPLPGVKGRLDHGGIDREYLYLSQNNRDRKKCWDYYHLIWNSSLR